ncbi:MAG: 3-phenylpropionic acid transporter [Proteobacteria bacterium SG_bin9]|nr:MAG: 3-phenylpropionic acid transporter [Proteobacteria bacterium SG_bin9]
MTLEPKITGVRDPAARRFAIRTALFYSTIVGLGGTYLPFFPVWLKAVGVDAIWIGIITAVPSVVRLSVLPLITRFAESRNLLRTTMIVGSVLTVVGFYALGWLREPLAIFIVFSVTTVVWIPLSSLTDGYALKGVARYGLNYGPLRLWGSIAFVVGTVICGTMLDLIDGKNLIWVLVAVAVLNMVSSFGLQRIDQAPGDAAQPASSPALLRNPLFLAAIFLVALIQASHAAYYTFSAIVWQGLGYSGFTIAALWALGVIAEIILFALSPRFTISPATQLLIGAVSCALRWVLTAQELPLPVLALVQLMHGLSFGMSHLGAVGLLVRLAPTHVIATAQGYQVAISGAVTGCVTVLVGAMFARLGDGVYYIMAVQALVGAVLVAVLRRRLDHSSVPG